MSTNLLIPGIQCAVGDWKYYICRMEFVDAARLIRFAHELHRESGDAESGNHSAVNEEQPQFRPMSPNFFPGSLVVAVAGGSPLFTPLELDGPAGLYSEIDTGLGVLSFDGTQQFHALDGQDRLQAIKDAVRRDPEQETNHVCLTLVPHYATPLGQLRTARLMRDLQCTA